MATVKAAKGELDCEERTSPLTSLMTALRNITKVRLQNNPEEKNWLFYTMETNLPFHRTQDQVQ